MLLTSPTVTRAQFEAGTGWELKAEGACKGDVCIPLTEPSAGGPDDLVDAMSLAEQMGLPLVVDEPSGLTAIGPESIGARTLATVDAPELTLPDHRNPAAEPEEFSLSSLRGRKVIMVAWSPY